jgi:hypothetical protein
MIYFGILYVRRPRICNLKRSASPLLSMMIQMIKGVSMSEITDSIVDLFIEKENQVMGVADFI